MPQFLIVAIICASASAALADGTQKHPNTALPGVDTDYQIVKPTPEPDESNNASTGQFKIGDMDVRIGGNVTVDVGAGALSRPRR